MEPGSSSADERAESQAYGRAIIGSLGAAAQVPIPRWRRGMAGTAPGGTRFVFYGGHIRASGSPAWRTNNPGKLFINAVSRSNGAIGNDGSHAIFPDVLTAQGAVSALLRAEGYSRLPVSQILRDFAWTPRQDSRIRALARGALVEPDVMLGDLASESIDRLSTIICVGEAPSAGQAQRADAMPQEITIISGRFTDSFDAKTPLDQVGAVYLPGSPRNPRWVGRVFANADPKGGAGGGTTGPANTGGVHYLNFPDNWQTGVWYQQQPDGTYDVSSSQNPRGDGAVGIFARYDGQNTWDIYGRGPGAAVPPQYLDGNYYSIETYIYDDGTKETIEHYPPNVDPGPVGSDCSVTNLSNGSTSVQCITMPPPSPSPTPSPSPGDGGNGDGGGDGNGGDDGEDDPVPDGGSPPTP